MIDNKFSTHSGLLIALILADFNLLIASAKDSCPPAEILHPCRCEYWNRYSHIICGGIWDPKFDLVTTFRRIEDLAVRKNRTFTFDKFSLRNSSAKSIPTNVFGTGLIKFNEMEISANRLLSKIDRDAFQGTKNELNFISIKNNLNLSAGFDDDDDIYGAVSKMANLAAVHLDRNNLVSVPAFGFVNLTKLTYISLHLNRITEIGEFAFSGCTRLNAILLGSNRIGRLSRSAFSHRISGQKFSNDMYINFWENLINSTSIERGTFDKLPEKTRINMDNNKLIYLEQDVFKAFLTINGTKLSVSGNPINCSSSGNQWLIKSEFRSKLIGFPCKS